VYISPYPGSQADPPLTHLPQLPPRLLVDSPAETVGGAGDQDGLFGCVYYDLMLS